jgi:hypothetical protein
MATATVSFVYPKQLADCKFCGQKICWQQSYRGRGNYPTNVSVQNGQPVSSRTDFHHCSQADRDAYKKRQLEAAGQQTFATPALNMSGVNALFDKAIANGLKYPKIRLQTPSGQPVALGRAGDGSKYRGQIMVTDGERFGCNRYFGRVTQEGNWVIGREDLPEVRTLLEQLGADPATVASQYGKLTGNCCFCFRRLDDPRSVSVGYGPRCATVYGLPWG